MKTQPLRPEILAPGPAPGGRSRWTFATALLAGLLSWALPMAASAQFSGTITITAYTGPGGAVVIPSEIDGIPVVAIGDSAFYDCTSVTSVTIPDSVITIGTGAFSCCSSLISVTISSNVTSIGADAFYNCAGLARVTIADSVTNIGDNAFNGCTSLTSVTIPSSLTSISDSAFAGCTSLTRVSIPDSVITIGTGAFSGCSSLTSLTIPSSVTSIGATALYNCTGLTSVYFGGNAPEADLTVFSGDSTTVYYLPGTTGWGPTLGGVATALWSLPNPLILNNGPSFGVQTNGFGFLISWAIDVSVVVETCTNLANPIWYPLSTNTLVGGSSYFNDPQWTNYARRFYRLRYPALYGCVPPPSNLAYWWQGEGNAIDSVSGNNGTLEGGVTYTNGEVGQAFNFDGVSGFISTSLLITNPQIFTLSLWFRTATTQGGVLISFHENQTSVAPNSGYYDRNIYMDNTGALHFGFWNPGPVQINSAAGYNDNHWHFAVGSLSASTGLTFYVDGVLVGNNPAAKLAQIYNGYWRIGECDLDNWPPPQPSSVYFNGQIDEVAIFNRVLSPLEVYVIYAAGSAGMCKP